MMKFIALSTLVAIAAAGHHGASSSNYRKQDDFGNYAFGYDIKDDWGNVNGRSEKGSYGHVVGSYYLGEIDGRHRSVEYVADKLGFRAAVKTNEPGTKTSEPAFAPLTSAFGKTIPSGSIQAAPVKVAASYAAPAYAPLAAHASYGAPAYAAYAAPAYGYEHGQAYGYGQGHY
ncbi:adult-specific rigid cuticular protein 15.7-like [Varroa jacobsoni]|uniref:Uncharacterized protein n=1 Tax=Varroa destructor TaxID=109461 RepID=A0A7M7JZB3_VARDE|nr:adult-specific rigid cuticular protein 15.7-like [Varroa destructor]XP_022701925.1 adult-specific rigid cuticular protein 15.7-like [Varroa jacobsoni]